MPQARRTRNDPRREATRTALIEAAESLFAESSFDSVSVRAIGAAIGSANANVVAYHFGSKEALIREIYRYRLPEIDRRRGELLDAADAKGKGRDLSALVRAFFQPLFEQTDSEGRHSYARFLAGLERSGMSATRGEVMDEFPETNRLEERIIACLPDMDRALLNARRRLVPSFLTSALAQIDQQALHDPALALALVDNAISMATAAYAAPVPQTEHD